MVVRMYVIMYQPCNSGFIDAQSCLRHFFFYSAFLLNFYNVLPPKVITFIFCTQGYAFLQGKTVWGGCDNRRQNPAEFVPELPGRTLCGGQQDSGGLGYIIPIHHQAQRCSVCQLLTHSTRGGCRLYGLEKTNHDIRYCQPMNSIKFTVAVFIPEISLVRMRC